MWIDIIRVWTNGCEDHVLTWKALKDMLHGASRGFYRGQVWGVSFKEIFVLVEKKPGEMVSSVW